MSTAPAIRFKCVGCGHKMKVSARHAGRKAKCAGCGKALRVPRPREAAPMQREGGADDSGGFLTEPVSRQGPASSTAATPAGQENTFDLEGYEADSAEDDGGYALDDEEPAWMHHAEAADAQSAALPKPGPAHAAARTNKPSVWALLNADVWGKICVIGIAFVWLCFLLIAVFGIDVMSLMSDSEYDTPGDMATPTGLLIAAAVTTVLLGPLALFRYRRAWGLLTRGVRVPCMIVKQGKFAKNDMLDVTFQYVYGGKTYKRKMSVEMDKIGSVTHLLIDPDKPGRCMLE